VEWWSLLAPDDADTPLRRPADPCSLRRPVFPPPTRVPSADPCFLYAFLGR
jgi:hypothetical protein